jgi:hypothetical protein
MKIGYIPSAVTSAILEPNINIIAFVSTQELAPSSLAIALYPPKKQVIKKKPPKKQVTKRVAGSQGTSSQDFHSEQYI